jgi:hypothetical protein
MTSNQKMKSYPEFEKLVYILEGSLQRHFCHSETYESDRVSEVNCNPKHQHIKMKLFVFVMLKWGICLICCTEYCLKSKEEMELTDSIVTVLMKAFLHNGHNLV